MGGAEALPLREGEEDAEGHLLAAAEAEMPPEAVKEPDREAVTEAQLLAVPERQELGEVEVEGELGAEGDARGEREPLPVALPLWLGEALEEPQRDA